MKPSPPKKPAPSFFWKKIDRSTPDVEQRKADFWQIRLSPGPSSLAMMLPAKEEAKPISAGPPRLRLYGSLGPGPPRELAHDRLSRVQLDDNRRKTSSLDLITHTASSYLLLFMFLSPRCTDSLNYQDRGPSVNSFLSIFQRNVNGPTDSISFFRVFREGISLPGRNFPAFPGMPPQTVLLISQIRHAVWRRFLKL